MKAEIAERIRLINKGQVPEGYKKTKVGIIPREIELIKLSYLITIKHGYAFQSEYFSDEGEYILLTPGHFNEVGGFKSKINKQKYFVGDFPKNYILRKHDLLAVMTEQAFGLLGSTLEILEDNKYLHNQRLGLIEVIYKKDVFKKFIYHIFNSNIIRKPINETASGTKVKHTSPDKMLNSFIPYFAFSEQQKMASILSTWDKAIELKEKLISEKKKQKIALMQELLTGKKRLDGFDGEWEKMKLGEASIIKKGKALSSKNIKEGHYPVIAGGKTSPYSHNEFTDENVITVSASGAYAGYVSFYKMKIWASDCTVIKEKPNKTIIDFLFFFMTYKQDDIYVLQTGGAQPHIYPKDLENIYISLPSIPEQTAIANILSLADKEISLLEKELQALKEQKKGLMQLLLTGIVRVN